MALKKLQKSPPSRQADKSSELQISAIILTRNSEDLVGECLKSIRWVDEIVVVDDGSADKTVEISKKYNAIIVKPTKRSFSEKRKIGAKVASFEWLLYIDADETVTSDLRKEIESIINNKKLIISAYAISRRNFLLGHEMKYGGWWPDYVIRLMRKKTLKGWVGELHEQPDIAGEIGKLKNPIVHNTHRDLTSMLAKTNEWSEIEARLMFEDNHPPMNILRFSSATFREFWYRAVKKMGFLDGPVGVIEIMYQVFSRFVSYAKLWEMQNKKFKVKSEKLKIEITTNQSLITKHK